MRNVQVQHVQVQGTGLSLRWYWSQRASVKAATPMMSGVVDKEEDRTLSFSVLFSALTTLVG